MTVAILTLPLSAVTESCPRGESACVAGRSAIRGRSAVYIHGEFWGLLEGKEWAPMPACAGGGGFVVGPPADGFRLGYDILVP